MRIARTASNDGPQQRNRNVDDGEVLTDPHLHLVSFAFTLPDALKKPEGSSKEARVEVSQLKTDVTIFVGVEMHLGWGYGTRTHFSTRCFANAVNLAARAESGTEKVKPAVSGFGVDQAISEWMTNSSSTMANCSRAGSEWM